MDSRPILKNTTSIQVFIDSETFDELLRKQNREAKAILNYLNSNLLEFVRNPMDTKFGELKSIPAYEVIESEGTLQAIKITKSQTQQITHFFGYKPEDIIQITKTVCKKPTVSENEIETVRRVFIQAIFNQFEKSNIYITNSKLLLKNRLWFESHFPGGPINIMTITEASQFLDLFFKKKGEYLAAGRYRLNKGFWYLLSLRLKLPHFNAGDPLANALANRFEHALMALDEIGTQHYMGPSNDKMTDTLYHFNHLIPLVTGIFDNLALKTNIRLGINFLDQRKMEISLSNSAGKEFLQKIRQKNPILRNHITKFTEFITLVYLFREKIIHREGLPNTRFESLGDTAWKANFIKIPSEIKQQLKRCNDDPATYDPFTTWGTYSAANEHYLGPYHASMELIKRLTEFVDKYLELLGEPSFINNLKKNESDFRRTLEIFETYHLGN